jgi:hypothetical protein
MSGFFAIGRSRLLELAPHTSGFKNVLETFFSLVLVWEFKRFT